MRRLVLFGGTVLVLAVAVHVAAVYAVPRYIMAKAMDRLGSYVGVNRALPAPRASAASRTVVRPSPDLLYTLCVYDLSQRPLRVTAHALPESYWSVSLYAANTDNYFVLNDRATKARELDFIVATRGQRAEGARVVRSPSTRGIVLFRMLIEHDADLPKLRALRLGINCAPH